MTEEEIEEQVEEYTKHNATIFYDARTDNPVYDDTEEIKQAWKDGAKWGMEIICKNILEEVDKDIFIGDGTNVRLRKIIAKLGVQI